MEPSGFALAQNYPNPFNPSTEIEFTLAQPSLVRLKVTNVLGEEIASVVECAYLEEGMHSFTFDASVLSSGEYFYHLTATDPETGLMSFSSVQKNDIDEAAGPPLRQLCNSLTDQTVCPELDEFPIMTRHTRSHGACFPVCDRLNSSEPYREIRILSPLSLAGP